MNHTESCKQNKKGWFFLRLFCFVVLTVGILGYGIYVLTPKYPEGIGSMMYYYGLEKDSVDVLAVGSSLTYTDLNTNVLWTEFGIASYDLATSEQPYWSTYYYLKEALKYQKPRLILLDLKAISYTEDRVKRSRAILCSYGILDPVNRLRCLYECVAPGDFLSYALGYYQVHTNYEAVTAADFQFPPQSKLIIPEWKGFLEKNAFEQHDKPFVGEQFAEPANLNAHETEYFERILKLCTEQEIPVLLIGYPNPDYKHDQMYYRAAFEIAEAYGITGIDYNLPEHDSGVNFYTDCADGQHLNVGGSVIFSRALARDLLERHDLPDHRGDPAYESYEICANQWFGKFPKYDRRAREN